MDAITAHQLAAMLKERTQKGIANETTALIEAGALLVGQKLPPLRELAYELGVSPGTISLAWRELRRQKIIMGRGRNGTIITGNDPSPKASRVEDLGDLVNMKLDLKRGVPDPALLPDLTQAYAYATSRSYLNSYVATEIIPELEATVKLDWPYNATSFVATDGGYNALYLTLSALIPPGSSVAVENPTSTRLLDIIENLNLIAIPVDTDYQGPELRSLAIALESRPVAFIYQPRLHSTTGRYVDAGRMREISEILRGTGIFVIEDDGVGAVSPRPALSLGNYSPEKVVHIRSYSKSHGPDLRIAVVSAPPNVVKKVQAFRGLVSPWTSRISQAALAFLLTSAKVKASLEAARHVYHQRHSNLRRALAKEGVLTEGDDGLSLYIQVAHEPAALNVLRQFGIAVLPGSRCSLLPANFIRVQTSLLGGNYAKVARAIRLAVHAKP